MKATSASRFSPFFVALQADAFLAHVYIRPSIGVHWQSVAENVPKICSLLSGDMFIRIDVQIEIRR